VGDGRFVVLVGVAVRGREPRLPSGALRAPRRRWEPVAWVQDRRVADAMVELLQEESPDGEARMAPIAELAATVGSAVAEALKDRLRNPTVLEVQRAQELERQAEERLRTDVRRQGRAPKGTGERRSGRERRSGTDRRRRAGGARVDIPGPRAAERRQGERRSGLDRRGRRALRLV
jgi:hypothetical protein